MGVQCRLAPLLQPKNQGSQTSVNFHRTRRCVSEWNARSHRRASGCRFTVLLRKSKLFLNRSCTILVWTNVLCQLRHTGAKNVIKNYQEPTTSQEKCGSKIPKFPPYVFLNVSVVMIKICVGTWTQSYLQCAISLSTFSKPPYFCMWNFVSGKVQYLPIHREVKSRK